MRSPRIFAAALLAAAAAGCSERDATQVEVPAPDAPVLMAETNAIPGAYIVVLKAGVAPTPPRSVAASVSASTRHVYTSALNGFATTLTQRQLKALQADPRVAYIQQDAMVYPSATQTPATWGLDRIDQRGLPLNNRYTYTPTGAGVRAYIIDSGIRPTHSEFGGRASVAFDATGGNGIDCSGHGTHVAGTVGGTTYGVAKHVTLLGVRVIGCTGGSPSSTIIAGINWVSQHRTVPAVATLSLNGPANQAIDDAVQGLINTGVVTVVAGGNNGSDACGSSPARAPEAITVGATSSSDSRSGYSNFGSCLDLFAPGTSITSAWYTTNTATNTISGTSMAAPHVAGVAALYLQSNLAANPAQVRGAIVGAATPSQVKSPGAGSPNLLLFSPLTMTGTAAPCTSCTLYSGSLGATGTRSLQPAGTFYQAAVSGHHKGWLRGPAASADFDLYLQKWNGSKWVYVASGESGSANEYVAYHGSPGFYQWEVYSYRGNGSYSLYLARP